jgi:hypothetical protein
MHKKFENTLKHGYVTGQAQITESRKHNLRKMKAEEK